MDVFGDFKFSNWENIYIIGAWSSPSGHGRTLFVFKEIHSKPVLLGVITSGEEDFIETDTSLGKDSNTFKIMDFDKDGKREILLSFLNSGYVFVELGSDKLTIDYDKKNYQAIDGNITSKAKKEFNKSFLTGTINKKKLLQKLKIYDEKEYILKKLGEEK